MYDGLTLNKAVVGYMILAAKNADIPPKKIDEMINSLRFYFDMVSVEAAANQDSPYFDE